jgi:hypothetical protein
MAELLCKLSPHYLDKLSQEEVDKMTKEQLQSYNARSQVGDIVCVSKDGGEASSPDSAYIIVKVKDYKLEEAKLLEQTLQKDIDSEFTRDVAKADWDNTDKQSEIISMDRIKPATISATLTTKDSEEVYTITGTKTDNIMVKHRKFNVNNGVVAEAIKDHKDIEVDYETFMACLVEKTY